MEDKQQTKQEMIEQLQLEMIIAKENGDDDLYQILVLIEAKLKKGQHIEEDPQHHS